VRGFDRYDFHPQGFPGSDWFDQVLACLVSPWNASSALGHKLNVRRLEAISQVAQLAIPEKCPVVLNGEGNQIKIWGRIAPRLRGLEYKAISLLIDEFPSGMSEVDLAEGGVPEAGKVLKHLCKKFEQWARVIWLPGKKASGGYRLLAAPRLRDGR
jgi:hypothetical protein